MLTRAKQTTTPARRSIYPTEKEALAMHTEPFKALIEETLVSIQDKLTKTSGPRLVRFVGGEELPCPVRKALNDKYPDMLAEAVLGFRMHGLSMCLKSEGTTMESFSQDLMKRLAKVDGCWPALLDHNKVNDTLQFHQVRAGLWLRFYNYSFEMTGDYKTAYKFVELYKDEIDRFVSSFRLRVCSYGPNDTVSITAEVLDHIRSEILTYGYCDVYPVEVVTGPAVALS